MSIKIVGVVGAGTMGSGIAQTFAQAGLDVRLVDVAQPLLDRARRSVESSLAKFVEKGRLSAADRDAALGRLSAGTTLDALAAADFVVEAIVEDVDAKKALFSALDGLTGPGACSRRTPRRSRSPCSARRQSARTGCSGCTS